MNRNKNTKSSSTKNIPMMTQEFAQDFINLVYGASSKDIFISIKKNNQSKSRKFFDVQQLLSSPEFNTPRIEDYRLKKICSTNEAQLIFSSLLHRSGGAEHAGRSVYDVLKELIISTEFNHNLLAESLDLIKPEQLPDILSKCKPHEIIPALQARYGETEGLKSVENYVREKYGFDAKNFDVNSAWLSASKNGTELPDWFNFHGFKTETSFRIIFDKPVSDDAREHESALVHLGPSCSISLARHLPVVFLSRMQALIPVIERFKYKYPEINQGSFVACLGDEGFDGPSLAFSSASGKSTLIPDAYFIASHGYADEKISYLANPRDFLQREDKAYWRGTDTGIWRYQNKLLAPRTMVSLISRLRSDILNASLTAIEARPGHEQLKSGYEQLNILSAREGQNEILNYRYQIDIDGNANSWNGFFLKLLSGAPVLKVKSEFGFKQWYYKKLDPWINFVPIASDLSDLIETIQFLQKNPILAESIGKQGQELALSLTYNSQLDEAAANILKLLLINK